MYDGLASQIVTTETAWGRVTRVLLPAHLIEGTVAALVASSRGDLAAHIRPSPDESAMVVHAGGRDWRYGGLG
jgi:hypothetical protein